MLPPIFPASNRENARPLAPGRIRLNNLLSGCLPYPEGMASGRDYRRKGDPFTLKVLRGEGPRAVRRWYRSGTGRDYFTRIMAKDCPALRCREVAPALREALEHLAAPRAAASEVLALEWAPWAGRVEITRRADTVAPPGAERLSLQATPTGPALQGVRLWLTCPMCEGRAGVLFASRWGAHGQRLPLEGVPMIGCRSCLGLTDESRQRHKCLDWAGAVHHWRPFAGTRWGRYSIRGKRTRERALRATLAACRGLLG